MEGEFAFTKAVGAFCKEAKKAGNFLENHCFNLREQIEQRAQSEKGKNDEVKIVLAGGSQVCRLKDGLKEWSNGGI